MLLSVRVPTWEGMGMQKDFVCKIRLSNRDSGGYRIEDVSIEGYKISIESQESDSANPLAVVCKGLISKIENEDDKSIAEVLSLLHYILWVLTLAGWVVSYSNEYMVVRIVAFIAFLFASYDFFGNHFKRIQRWGLKVFLTIAFGVIGVYYFMEIWGWLKGTMGI